MIDIDKQLEKLDIKSIKPDDSLVNKTKSQMRNIAGKQDRNRRKKTWKTIAIAVPAAAAFILVGLMFIFMGRSGAPVTAESAFYTIDINPSIVLEVDNSNRIISISCRNDEALELMANIQCLGLDIKDAIPKIVTEAKALGYISDDKENYVLIASFGDDNKRLSEDEINAIVQEATGGEANILYLMGSLQDKEDAEEKGKSAGIYLLEKHAKEQGIVEEGFEPDEQEGSLIEDIEAITLPVSNIVTAVDGEMLILEWDKIEHNEFSGYKIVASQTNSEPKYPDDGFIDYITDSETTRLVITEGFGGLVGGKSYWFSITALFKGGFTSAGNSVLAEVPVKVVPTPEPTLETTPSPEPSPVSTPEPTSIPTPIPTQSPVPEVKGSANISGVIGDNGVELSWDKITHTDFNGYKVVASKTNPNPKYPEDGYIKYITDPDLTAKTFQLSNFDSGATYWFSITALYDDGTKVAGNSISLIIPEYDQGTTGNSSAISGYIEGDLVVLNWEAIDSASFQGYKVVASKSNPNPSYPNDGYIRYITDSGTVGIAVNEGFSGLKGGTGYYFSITVLYKDGSKVPGNSVYLVVPDSIPSGDAVASLITGEVIGESIYLQWDKITDSSFNGYKVVASPVNPNPKYPEDGYIKYITNAEANSLLVYDGFNGLTGGISYYFSITVLYSDGTKVPGNSVYIEVPDTDSGSGEMPSTTISGSAGEGIVNLSWNKIDHPQFSGYKVVASKTNPNPSYPGDGYLEYITDRNQISYSSAFNNFDSGETYWFSITVLYSDGTKKAGNSVAIEIPEGEGLPFATVYGVINEGKVVLEWDVIEHTLFQGYKVVASKTNPNPSYPDDGYLQYITVNTNNRFESSVGNFDSGETYWFSITVLYTDGSKIAGNAVQIEIP